MSEFTCEVVRVKIEAHPNADAIEIARVGDYQSIVRKNQFRDGDLAVYIPEQAVVPEWLLKDMKLWDEAKSKGVLAGSLGNRVKAIKLRGIVSQGLVLGGDQVAFEERRMVAIQAPNPNPIPAQKGVVIHGNPNWETNRAFYEGDDAAEHLGIIKYEQPIPTHMAGRIVGADLSATAKYDFENLKKLPSLFDDGEEVVITEKIHGTLIQVGIVPVGSSNEKYYGGRVVISSKGMGAKGFILDHNDETNLYAQAAKKHGLLDGMLREFGDAADVHGKPIFIFGEVFGCTRTSGGDKGIQDLTYTGEILDFRAFDIAIGNRGQEVYLRWDYFEAACARLGVKTVPLLYRGPYDKQVVLKHTDGTTTLSSKKGITHIREGVVVKSAAEQRNRHFGRKIAKSISNAYLLRKDATEFN